MQPIGPPDAHRLMAASGWLDLGCPDEALAELDGLSAENRRHPDALELRWMVLVQRGDWPSAFLAASKLVEVAPERPSGWLHRAYAIRRLPEGGLEKAWNLLLPCAEKFPTDSVIPYNLACYACQMGWMDESRRWLQRALESGTKETIKGMALQDEDLRPLWTEIACL
jgi:uncharacterized protein HemY